MKKSIISHPKASELFLKNESRANWHDEALWFVRQKRDKAVNTIPEWEELRETASQIKNNVLANLDTYLIQFESNATKNGIDVHWATDAKEHNEIIWNILKKKQVRRIVKSKSMLTEECHLNEYLTSKNISVVDTDLGERIVQLAGQHPSHIVLPAIHLKKEDVGSIFHEHLGTIKGADDPAYLTEAARHHLREKFLNAEAALTGVNFAIASTGGFVVCTNEGNADMGVHLAKIHIASMGIEKIIPELDHLSIFLRLLARNATGQPITTYSSHFVKPAKDQEIHIILVDNGRTRQLGRPKFRTSLKCIRCGACLNTCPVYRRSGGHSYHNVISGPIGSILAPNLDMKESSDLPFASTLCGSCTNVCPVKIDIHEQLYQWRQEIVQKGYVSISKKWSLKIMAFVLSTPLIYRAFGQVGRKLMKFFPALFKIKSLNAWTKQREMPSPPKASFRTWYLKNRKNDEK